MSSRTVDYFAFGSNMSSARLLARIAEAKSLGRARLDGWRFVCNKRGLDGSAKANIMRRDGANVWGVVFRLPEAALETLDAIEGGYDRTSVHVVHNGERLAVSTYCSTRMIDDSVALDWYKRHILAGAEEHRLPADYIAFLSTLPMRSPGH